MVVVVKIYSNDNCPKKYKEAIVKGSHCVRRGEAGISSGWLEIQVERADYLLVALKGSKVVGFLLGFAKNKDNHKDMKTWTVDSICRQPGADHKDVAPALLDAFAEKASRKGIRQLALLATTPEARDAYEGYGFISTNKRAKDSWPMKFKIA